MSADMDKSSAVISDMWLFIEGDGEGGLGEKGGAGDGIGLSRLAAEAGL